MAEYDFAGWATVNGVKCTDGRTIEDGAFAHNDGKRVPLVYQHDHSSPSNILGYAILKNIAPKGVRCYGYFNDTSAGIDARKAVMHGDLTAISVFANHLKEQNGFVKHGDIKEVSLVMAGANPGALIDVIMKHSDGDGFDGDIAIITTDENIDIDSNDDQLQHADGEEADGKAESAQEILDTMTEKQKNCCFYMMEQAVLLDRKERGADVKKDDAEMSHSDEDDAEDSDESNAEESEETIEDETESTNSDDTENSETEIIDEGENDIMKHNAFEDTNTIQHDEQYELAKSFMEDLNVQEIIEHAQKTHDTFGKEFLAHADDYGIKNLELLFPDFKNLDDNPQWINQPDEWVSVILNGVKHVPFSKIRSLFADITKDEARARGYTKGKKKIEEVFSLLKRETEPTTVYKKQKLDRDDIIDLNDMTKIGWLRQEMRGKLNEELARAYVVGDGRDPLTDADNKIKEDKIRPMAFDDILFTVPVETDGTAKNFIQTAIRSRKQYRGSGRPILITSEDMLTEMLLLEDLNQRIIYDTEDKLKTALRVTQIVTAPFMETTKSKDNTKQLFGVIVNLADYTVGTNQGGQINWFEDFDIDFNQNKYLVETRCSGALTKPKSCITLWKTLSNVTPEPSDDDTDDTNP